MNKTTFEKNPGMKHSPGFFGHDFKHRGMPLKGWMLPPKSLQWYRDVVSKIKNGIVVEVGVYGGMSILSVVDLCIKNNNKIYGIDPWETSVIVNGKQIYGNDLELYKKKLTSARTNLEKIIKKFNYTNIELITGFSPKESEKFENNSIDIAYIDGDHSYGAVLKDLSVWIKKIKPNGFLWGDDFNWISVKNAVIDFSKKEKLHLKNMGRSWYMQKL